MYVTVTHGSKNSCVAFLNRNAYDNELVKCARLGKANINLKISVGTSATIRMLILLCAKAYKYHI